jgi:hypothetical protein
MSHRYQIQTNSIDTQGIKCAFISTDVEAMVKPMPHHVLGLSYTATGYGKRIPTEIMVKWEGKWRRVYCYCYSNIGSCYIGKLSDNLVVHQY